MAKVFILVVLSTLILLTGCNNSSQPELSGGNSSKPPQFLNKYSSLLLEIVSITSPVLPSQNLTIVAKTTPGFELMLRDTGDPAHYFSRIVVADKRGDTLNIWQPTLIFPVTLPVIIGDLYSDYRGEKLEVKATIKTADAQGLASWTLVVNPSAIPGYYRITVGVRNGEDFSDVSTSYLVR